MKANRRVKPNKAAMKKLERAIRYQDGFMFGEFGDERIGLAKLGSRVTQLPRAKARGN